ncbi:MAG: polysaccharide deacetylase family protein [Bacteroidota bacterium]
MKFLKRIEAFFFVKPPDWFRRISTHTVWRIPTDEKVLFLTFDDGPVPGNTGWILAELDKYEAKGTFFCVGGNVVKYPKLYRMILDAGHDAGNHTSQHLNSYRTGIRKYIKDVYRARKVIESRLFRPPYGRIRPIVTRILSRHFTIILWDILSMDYDRELPPEKVLDNVITAAGPGSIVVFHDNIKARKNLEYVLPKVLDHYAGQGYKFVPLSQFLL